LARRQIPQPEQVGDASQAAQHTDAQSVEDADPWSLEKSFPSVKGILAPSLVRGGNDETIVALDTNALLLPFRVGTQELPKLEEIYSKLISTKRFFIPARVLREYVRNRDSRLAEILKELLDKGSRTEKNIIDIPPLLNGLEQTQAVIDAMEKLQLARKAYLTASNALGAVISGWRGDDPVTSMYHRLFSDAVIIDFDEPRAEVEKLCAERYKRKIPPGYKDAGKADAGIGDYAIWLSLLKLGRMHKKDLIFVTGDEKADWFVRMGKDGVYPRPELVSEYRAASDGKGLRLSSLADVLADMDVPEDTVREVRDAETAENAAGKIFDIPKGYASRTDLRPVLIANEEVCFDYSQHDGQIRVGTSAFDFLLRFSKSDERSIHFYRSSHQRIARGKDVARGELCCFEEFDSTSSHYTLSVGDLFIVRDAKDYLLVGRLINVQDDTRGSDHDDVVFEYTIFGPGYHFLAP